MREPAGAHPPLDYPPYKSTALRHPKQPLIYLPHTITEITGPALGDARAITPGDADLTGQHEGEPIGERIIVSGRVFDTEGKPLRNTLVEVWQANAAGRYRHRWDRWPAPLDPNFSGAGRCLTDDDGRYQLHHDQARARIRGATTTTPGGRRTSTSRCWGAPSRSGWSRRCTSRATRSSRMTRSSTRVRDEAARERMISRFSIHGTQPDWAPAYEFDIYLRGPAATPFEEAH